MPFKSKAQMKWMFANKPQMAKEWASETNMKKLKKSKRDTLSKRLNKHGMSMSYSK